MSEDKPLKFGFISSKQIRNDKGTVQAVVKTARRQDRNGDIITAVYTVNKNGPINLEEFYENGNIAEKGSFTAGAKDGRIPVYGKCGLFESFYKNGQPHRKYNYSEELKGHLNGTCEIYWPNGKLKCQCACRDGLLHGDYKTYDQTGKLRRHVKYEDGTIIRTQQSQDQGLIARIFRFGRA